ncbi:MAG: hypothetical protein PHO57_04890, partial [Acidithiobacillus sp.]|nr:hypothetical protein [Acidithiobacillus sp.]
MSMLPVGGLAAPEQAVAVSAKAETNSGDSASGFAQVLSQQSEKGAVAAQGEGKVQDAPGVVRSSTEGQLLRKGEAGPMQQAGTSAQAAASSQKTRIEPHGKDQRAFAGSTRELVEGPVMHGLPANPSGLQLVGRSAEGSSATKTPAVKMSPVNPALLLSDDEAKKDVKNGKVFKNAANGDTPLPILLVPANLSIVTPEGGKANAEVKSTQSGRLPHDLLSNGILRSHQASSGSTPS